MHAQLVVDVPVVVLDGILVYAQQILYLLAGAALKVQVEYLALPGRERVQVGAELPVGLRVYLLHPGGVQVGERALCALALTLHVRVFRLQPVELGLAAAVACGQVFKQVVYLGYVGGLALRLVGLQLRKPAQYRIDIAVAQEYAGAYRYQRQHQQQGRRPQPARADCGVVLRPGHHHRDAVRAAAHVYLAHQADVAVHVVSYLHKAAVGLDSELRLHRIRAGSLARPAPVRPGQQRADGTQGPVAARRVGQPEVDVAYLKAAYAYRAAAQPYWHAHKPHPLPRIGQLVHLREHIPARAYVLAAQQGLGLREGPGLGLELPGAVKAYAALPRHRIAAPEHAGAVIERVLRVEVGVLEVEPVVIGPGEGVVHRAVQQVERAAAGGQLHVQADLGIGARLYLAQRLLVVAQPVKVKAALAQHRADRVRYPVGQHKAAGRRLVRVVQQGGGGHVQLPGQPVLQLAVYRVDYAHQIQHEKEHEGHGAGQRYQVCNKPLAQRERMRQRIAQQGGHHARPYVHTNAPFAPGRLPSLRHEPLKLLKRPVRQLLRNRSGGLAGLHAA